MTVRLCDSIKTILGRGSFFLVRVFPAVSAVLLFGITAARADCSPTLGTITPAATSLSVSWTESCGGPGHVELRWYNKGRNYTLLGSEGPLSNLANAGAVKTSVPLTTGMPYAPLELCAVFGTGAVTTTVCGIQFGGVPENPSGQPLPVITFASASQTEIDYAWEALSAYSSYNVTITGLPQHNTTAYGFPWTNLNPGTQYTIGVQGCVYGGVAGKNCGPFAYRTLSTLAAPPPPEAPPQNLHTIVSASGVQVVWTESLAEQQSSVDRFTTHAGLTVQLMTSGTTVSFNDPTVVAGQTYTYTVCLIARNGGAQGCASTTAVIAPPPPVCAFSTGCAFYQDQPPQFTLSCTAPVDFYSWSGTPVDAATPPPSGMIPLATNTNSTSGSTTGETVFVAACNVGTRDQCVSHSIYVDQGQWCHPQNGSGSGGTPPVLTGKACQQCRDAGGICVRSGGGFICKGTLQ